MLHENAHRLLASKVVTQERIGNQHVGTLAKPSDIGESKEPTAFFRIGDNQIEHNAPDLYAPNGGMTSITPSTFAAKDASIPILLPPPITRVSQADVDDYILQNRHLSKRGKKQKLKEQQELGSKINVWAEQHELKPEEEDSGEIPAIVTIKIAEKPLVLDNEPYSVTTQKIGALEPFDEKLYTPLSTETERPPILQPHDNYLPIQAQLPGRNPFPCQQADDHEEIPITELKVKKKNIFGVFSCCNPMDSGSENDEAQISVDRDAYVKKLSPVVSDNIDENMIAGRDALGYPIRTGEGVYRIDPPPVSSKRMRLPKSLRLISGSEDLFYHTYKPKNMMDTGSGVLVVIVPSYKPSDQEQDSFSKDGCYHKEFVSSLVSFNYEVACIPIYTNSEVENKIIASTRPDTPVSGLSKTNPLTSNELKLRAVRIIHHIIRNRCDGQRRPRIVLLGFKSSCTVVSSLLDYSDYILGAILLNAATRPASFNSNLKALKTSVKPKLFLSENSLGKRSSLQSFATKCQGVWNDTVDVDGTAPVSQIVSLIHATMLQDIFNANPKAARESRRIEVGAMMMTDTNGTTLVPSLGTNDIVPINETQMERTPRRSHNDRSVDELLGRYS